MDVEIDSADVVRLMMQFCLENGLHNSLTALHAETGVGLSSLPPTAVKNLLHDVRSGHWDKVLAAVSPLHLPRDTVLLLHEQALFELLEAGATEVAAQLLLAQPLAGLRQEQSQRWFKLESLCTSTAGFSTAAAYEIGESKAIRREQLAFALQASVGSAAPCRLLTLLGQAIRGGGGSTDGSSSSTTTTAAAVGGAWDLLADSSALSSNVAEDADEAVGALHCTAKADAEAHAEIVAFSSDGQSMALGACMRESACLPVSTCLLFVRVSLTLSLSLSRRLCRWSIGFVGPSGMQTAQ